MAHHIAAALAPECVSGDGERELLDHYHAELCAALAASGAAQDAAHAASSVISRAQLQTQYESALLDMCRLVFAYQVRVRVKDRDRLRVNGLGLGLRLGSGLGSRL